MKERNTFHPFSVALPEAETVSVWRDIAFFLLAKEVIINYETDLADSQRKRQV